MDKEIYDRDDIIQRISNQIESFGANELIDFCERNFGGENHKYNDDDTVSFDEGRWKK